MAALVAQGWLWGGASAQPLPSLLPLIQQHPSVLQAQSLTRSAQSEIEVATEAGNLRLSLSLGMAYSRNPDRTNENRAALFAPALRVTVPIYDHGRLKAEVSGREFARDAQAARAEVAQESVSQQLMTLYIDALTYEVGLKVLSDQAAKLEELLAKVRAVAAIDTGRRYEVSQVQARLSAVLATKDARSLQLREANQQMRSLLRVPQVSLYPLSDLRELGVLPRMPQPLAALLKERHPSMRVARLEVAAQEMALTVASKWNLPRWTLESELTSERDDTGKTKHLRAVSVRVGANVDLFDGAAAAGASVQAHKLSATQDKVDVQLLELEQAFERLWLLLPLREQQMNGLQRQVDATREMRQVAFDQFVAGRRPLTDLINFENEYFSAVLQLEELRVQTIATQWQLVAATGHLTHMANPASLKTSLGGL